MKPRLEVAPATREDRLIWLNVNIPTGRPRSLIPYVSDMYHRADRRDAELMFQLARCRGHPGGENSGQLGLEESGHPMPSLRLVERYFPFRPHRYDILNFA